MYSVVVLSLENWQVLKMRELDPSYPNLHILVTDTESVNHALQLRGVKQMKALHVENPIEYKRILHSEGIRTFNNVEDALEGAREIHEEFKASGRKSLALGLRLADGTNLPIVSKAEHNRDSAEVNAPKVSVTSPSTPPKSDFRPRYLSVDLGPASVLSVRAKNVLTTFVQNSDFDTLEKCCRQRPLSLEDLRMLRNCGEQTAQEIFDLLLEEGWVAGAEKATHTTKSSPQAERSNHAATLYRNAGELSRDSRRALMAELSSPDAIQSFFLENRSELSGRLRGKRGMPSKGLTEIAFWINKYDDGSSHYPTNRAQRIAASSAAPPAPQPNPLPASRPTQNTPDMAQPFIKADTALESMRDSDFDCYSAYAEAIDNSIQAQAKRIWVDFLQHHSANRTSSTVGGIVFTDDGEGMNADLLHKCLTLGHSSRYNDRDGIGRFGVGMTLGAIHECRRIEVYSKQNSGRWLFTYMDLDEIADRTMGAIPLPVPKEPHPTYKEKLAGSPSGTIVKWLKCDRAKDSYERVLEESRFYFGRTFRKYIWGTARLYNKIEVVVNDRVVPAFDPLFVTTELTAFPDDPKAELFPSNSFEWTSYKFGRQGRNRINGRVGIEMSLLPFEFRSKQGDGGSANAKERKIDRNEGVSILRNDREVFFGHIPHIGSTMGYSGESERNKTRFIGIEISFDAELDEAFTVKNIKRGAVPVKDLKDKLSKLIKPTVKTLLDRIGSDWSKEERKAEAKEAEGNESVGIVGGHTATNAAVKPIANKIRMKQGVAAADETQVAQLVAEAGADPMDIENMRARLEQNKLTVIEKDWPGNTFMTMEHANSFKTLIYNSNSGFRKNYSKFFNILAEKDARLSKEFEVLVDVIFLSFMLGESDLPDGVFKTKFFQDNMKQSWALRMEEIMQYLMKHES